MAEAIERNDKKTRKTALKVLRITGFVFLLVLTVVLTINALLSVFVKHYYPTFGEYRLFAIVSDSMEPEIPTGNMIVGRVPYSESEIDVGTVITYELPQGNSFVLITHRVVQVLQDEQGNVKYVMRGDNAQGNDSYRPSFNEVVGIYTGNRCGFFGYMFGFLQSSTGAIALIIILLIIALTWTIVHYVNLVQVWRSIALNALQKSRGMLLETRIEGLETLADVIGIATKDPQSKNELNYKNRKLELFLNTGRLPKRPYRNEAEDDIAFLNSAPATETILKLIEVSKVDGDANAQNTEAETAVSSDEERRDAEAIVSYEETAVERSEKMRYVYSYTAKLVQLKEEAKEWYNAVKNEILSYKKVRSRTGSKGEIFMSGKQTVAKITVRGKTLCLSLALSPDSYAGSKFSVENGKGSTPAVYRIRSALRSRYALLLIADAFKAVGIEKDENYQMQDFYMPYEGTVALLQRGLVRRKLTDRNRRFKIIEITDDGETES